MKDLAVTNSIGSSRVKYSWINSKDAKVSDGLNVVALAYINSAYINCSAENKTHKYYNSQNDKSASNDIV